MLIRPMLATSGELPLQRDEADWSHEIHWDGVRAVVYVDGGQARVLTRNDRDVTGIYPSCRRWLPCWPGRRPCSPS